MRTKAKVLQHSSHRRQMQRVFLEVKLWKQKKTARIFHHHPSSSCISFIDTEHDIFKVTSNKQERQSFIKILRTDVFTEIDDLSAIDVPRDWEHAGPLPGWRSPRADCASQADQSLWSQSNNHLI